MYHHSKLITMFAMSITKYLQNAGCQLAFTVQAFFMPGHKVYQIWYPCTPVWSVNAPTAFCRCDRQRERHGYFHFKKLLLCLTIQKLSTLLQTASKRPPTKRVSPLPAILTLILPLTASTYTDAPSATCAQRIQKAIPSPGDLTSPDVKRLPEQLLMKPLFSSWWRRSVSITAMCLNATNVSVNAIWTLGDHAILNSRSTIVTSPLCSHLHKLVNFNFIAQPAINVGCAGILHPKINSILLEKGAK